MRSIGLLGLLHAYADAVSHAKHLDGPTKRQILERAVADANDLRPSVSEFEASSAHQTIDELKQLVADAQ